MDKDAKYDPHFAAWIKRNFGGYLRFDREMTQLCMNWDQAALTLWRSWILVGFKTYHASDGRQMTVTIISPVPLSQITGNTYVAGFQSGTNLPSYQAPVLFEVAFPKGDAFWIEDFTPALSTDTLSPYLRRVRRAAGITDPETESEVRKQKARELGHAAPYQNKKLMAGLVGGLIAIGLIIWLFSH